MKKEERKDLHREMQKLGIEENNGFCLVMLHEINSLSYTENQTGFVNIAELKCDHDSPPQIAEVLIMLSQGQKDGITQSPIWLSVAALATLKNQTSNARLIAAAPDILEALECVRSIIREGLEVGLNPLYGDWADRLFESQGITGKAIRKAKEG